MPAWIACAIVSRGRDDFAILDDAFGARLGAELARLLKSRPDISYQLLISVGETLAGRLARQLPDSAPVLREGWGGGLEAVKRF
jgi:hypothetical protein